MFLIFGATGNTGRAAAERLLAAGQRVRAVSRSAERLQGLAAAGAEPMAGDVRDASFLARALDGADGAYLVLPFDFAQEDLRAFYNAIGDAIAQALRAAPVPRVVLLSSIGAELDSGTGPIAALHDVEEKLRTVGAPALFLRPGYFYENFYSALPLIQTRGLVADAMAPDVPLAMTCARDVGAAAAEALIAPEFRTGVREVLGPRDYTMVEATLMLGAALGKPDLPYVQVPDAELAAGLRQAGFSEGTAALVVQLAHAVSTGLVRPLQGRTPSTTAPTPLEAFARDFLAASAFHA